MYIKPIETSYKGYKMRSRLEARWAVWFDKIGVTWEYEPEGFELGNGIRYLPDFYLPDFKVFVEVKRFLNYNTRDIENMTKNCKLLRTVTKQSIIFVNGEPGRDVIRLYTHIATSKFDKCYECCPELYTDNNRHEVYLQELDTVCVPNGYVSDELYGKIMKTLSRSNSDHERQLLCDYAIYKCNYIKFDVHVGEDYKDVCYSLVNIDEENDVESLLRFVGITDSWKNFKLKHEVNKRLLNGLKNANTAAKSARFEFGESGA